MAKVEVGKEYVLGSLIGDHLSPVQCNPGPHPCRVKITSVGRKYARATISGYSKPQQVGRGTTLNTDDGLWTIDAAKASYRAALEAREVMWKARGDKGLGQERVDQLVEGL